MAERNGINMLDVKQRNRSAILELIYKNNALPRKEIATALGLTPAAITLITTDMINEGLLYESSIKQVQRRGRREVLLKIKSSNYLSIGINITKHHFELTLMDLTQKLLYRSRYHLPEATSEHNVINRILQSVKDEILMSDMIGRKKIIGVGVSILGIVDSENGISVNSYGILPNNFALGEYVSNSLSIPCLVVNNICACANGEFFLSKFAAKGDLLFIKYGPGVGAATFDIHQAFDPYSYEPVEIGHMIMEPYGRPCVCGNRGCLETIVSYDSIAQSVIDLNFKTESGSIQRSESIREKISREYTNSEITEILSLYNDGERGIETELNRVVYYLALAIKNTLTIMKPEDVILYGPIFENEKFRDALYDELKVLNIDNQVHLSANTKELEAIGPATTMISNFLSTGGNI